MYSATAGLNLLNTLRIILILQVSTSPHLFYSTTTYYRSTRRQNPKSHTITTGHHVTTSPYILLSTTTYYRSTRRKNLHNPQNHTNTTGHHVLTTSHILYYYLPQVNTSSKPSESYQYYRSPCPNLAIYLILYYYLLQVYRSTLCQNPQKHTSTTGHHVTTSPYILFSTTT